MSYLLKSKRRQPLSTFKVFWFLFTIGLLLSLLFSDGLSAISRKIFSPLWSLKETIFQSDTLEATFRSQKSIIAENENLTDELAKARLALLSYDKLKKENEEMRTSLGGLSGMDAIRTEVLVRPPISLYDTFVIRNVEGIEVGDKVLAYGSIPIGEIVELSDRTALVRLFSAPGNVYQVTIGEETMELRGVGGGNFQIRIPKAVIVEVADKVYMPGTNDLIGIVDEIEIKETDSFKTLFVKSPINIFKVTAVEVLR